MVGELISHYRVTRQLGAGGMGVVYLARDEQLGRDVAIKVLAPGALGDEEARARFRREGRLLAQLNNPYIEMVFDFGTLAGQDYIVLEYVPGETLRDSVAQGALAEDEVLRLGSMLAAGLEAAHEKGILHRDLKPGNLIRTSEGRLKILDFGLAVAQRVPDSDEAENQGAQKKILAGTLPYMPPEQVRGESGDVRSDIYSAGAVLFELATGKPPFTNADPSELMDSILHETPPAPRQFNEKISPLFEALLLKTLQKVPADRQQSAAELRGEMERVKAVEQSRNAAGSLEPSQAPALEMAYVLFTDIVGYSRLATDTQQHQLRQLQRIVRGTADFQRAQKDNRLIRLPTGDGMALAFFVDPESPVRCAIEISRALQEQPEIQLRMGMHAGPVYRVTDINGNQNVAGEGINIAQRVMDAGDAGHLLISKALADVLRQLTGWQKSLRDLGEVSVKHDVQVHMFNLLAEGVGNPALPDKIKAQRAKTKETAPVPRKMLTIATAAMLAALVGIAIWTYGGRIFGRKSFRPTVAVLGFKNQTATPESEWVSTSLSDMLAAELSAGDQMVAAPGESVARMKTDMGLPSEANYAPETIHKVRSALNCDYVVYGAFFDPGKSGGGRVRLDLRLQNAASGEVLATVTESGTELALPELASRLGATLRAKLGMPGISMSQSSEIQAAVPSTPEATREYFEGLARLRNFDLLRAKDSLSKAVSADPNFSLAHAYLAEAWQALGYDQKAKEEAKTGYDLSTHLSREDKILVEARFREISSDWDKAIDLYRSLWTLYPENPEYAYRAADVQIRAGKAKDALLTVEALRKQPGELAGNPVIELREAEAWEALGDYEKEKTAAQKAQEIAAKKGARLVQGQAAWRACGAFRMLGQLAAAKTACQQAVQIAQATGDQLLAARSVTTSANIAQAQGDLTEALRQHRRALDLATKVGSRRDVVGALTNIGLVQSTQADHAAAQKSFQEGLVAAGEINDQEQTLTLLNNLAAEKQITGDFTAALRLYEKSLQTARTIQYNAGVGRALGNIGSIYSLQGNFPAALQNIQDALTSAQETGLKSDQVGFFYALGDTNLAEGDLAAAESNYQAGEKLATQIDDKINLAVGQLSIANLRLLQDKAQEALALARQAVDVFHAQGMNDQEGQTRNLMASCYLDLDDREAAGKELLAAQALSPQDPTIKLAVLITASRIALRGGNALQGKKDLQSVSAEAQRMGTPGIQFEARLAEGEWGLYGGDKRLSLAVLSGVERRASVKGFKEYELRARKAKSLLGSKAG